MELMFSKNKKLSMALAVIIVCAALFLILFNHWEMSSESWGYWLFARVFAESGRFVISDRAPLYTLYLNLFRWLDYPLSVITEHIISSLIVILALVAFCRRYVGIWLSLIASLLWLPFIQTMEPPVQKFALAFSCLAVVLRLKKEKRLWFVISYAMLGIAYLFRSTYLILILIFALWDICKNLKRLRLKAFTEALRPRLGDWPLFIVIGLCIYFLAFQSPHRWNNAFFTTTTWFPTNGKTLTEGAFLQHCNWEYIKTKYGTYKGKDFYFTNQELFGQANTVLGAIRANPQFMAKRIMKNAKSIIPVAVDVTKLHAIYLKLQPKLKFSVGWFCLFSLIAILYGAFRQGRNESLVLFFIGSILIISTSLLLLPKDRYMFPLIPLFIFSAYWYGLNSARVIERIFRIKNIKNWPIFISVFLFLILFSSGITDWQKIICNFTDDIRKGDVRILESRPYSMKASFMKLIPLVEESKGIMVFEHTFVASFIQVPLERVFDIMEIPPFGSLDNSVYKGLTPKRINCLLISRNLINEVGIATNSQLRYENYIKPYAEKLKSLGAKVYRIEEFGDVVILPSS